MMNTRFILAIVVAMMFLLGDVNAQDCNPNEDIKDCYLALIAKGLPSPICCEELDHHRNCLCKYIDINQILLPPHYQYLPSLANTCGVFFPVCELGL
ncbi:hypothetical protein Lser_V15G40050 [Lactuca serriola]